MTYLVPIIALLFAYVVWRLIRGWKTIFAEATTEVRRRWEADANLVEVAPWFGTTGLSEDDERELPRYLRREFGEVGAEDGLKASDLRYLGVQTDERGAAHFWVIPKRDEVDDETYAYIDTDDKGNALGYGWGDRKPNQK